MTTLIHKKIKNFDSWTPTYDEYMEVRGQNDVAVSSVHQNANNNPELNGLAQGRHITLCIFTVVQLLLNVITFADVINVPEDDTSIQAGIDAAADGDTILVAPGEYLENIDFKGKTIFLSSHYFLDQDPSYISSTL